MAKDYEYKEWVEDSFGDVAEVLVVKDAHGTVLVEGDSVTVIKDLKVKGATSDIKRGTLFKSIRLTDTADEIEGGTGRNTMVLKTEFVKKVS